MEKLPCLICGKEINNVYPDDIESPGQYDSMRYKSSVLAHASGYRYETLIICDPCADAAKSNGRIVNIETDNHEKHFLQRKN